MKYHDTMFMNDSAKKKKNIYIYIYMYVWRERCKATVAKFFLF